MNTNELHKLLDPYDKCALECDGMTKVIHTIMTQHKIPHSVYIGGVTVNGEFFEPHFWIILPNGDAVDYRLRMWFGNKAPHGIFKPESNGVEYDGKKVNLPVLSNVLFQILTM